MKVSTGADLSSPSQLNAAKSHNGYRSWVRVDCEDNGAVAEAEERATDGGQKEDPSADFASVSRSTP